MEFKERYKNMCGGIKPDERLVKDTVVKMKKTKHISRLKIAGIAAAVCASAAAVLFISGVFSDGSNSTDRPIAYVTSGQQAQLTATDTAVPRPFKLTGGPVKFSELGLDFPSVNYPKLTGGETACLAVFSESMIKDSKLIIQGTVTEVRFNKYFKNEITALYEVRIDDILYSEEDADIGDIIKIEENLWMGTSLQDELVGLKPGGRYILPIRETPAEYGYIEESFYTNSGDDICSKYILQTADADGVSVSRAKALESRYSIIYPYIPPIQVVEGGGFLFPSSWESLVSEDAVQVIMDEPAGEAQYGELYYRELYVRDESFLSDFKKLIDKYTSEEYRKEHTPVITNNLIIENGKVKTNENLVYLYAEKQLTPYIMIDLKHLSDEDKKRFIAQSKTEPYPIIISEFVCKQTKNGDWTAEYTEFTENGQKSGRIEIPSFLDLPTDEQLITLARRYLTPAYQDLKGMVIFDGMNYNVKFENAHEDIVIRADINILGTLTHYTVFEN